jgi:hypothetical protein
MDHQRDFDNFRKLMARLCTTMDKFPTDELVESWWKALRTVQFHEIERRIEAFIARAGENTKFPRPGQMRPEDSPAYDPREEARDRHVREENTRSWRAFIVRHPTTGPIRLKLAQAARILANTHESDAAYAEARDEESWLLKQLGEHGRFAQDY